MKKPIWKSRKFLIVMVDAIVGFAALLATRYMTPEDARFLGAMWAIWQPAVLVYIGSIAWEDSAAIKAGTHPSQQQKE